MLLELPIRKYCCRKEKERRRKGTEKYRGKKGGRVVGNNSKKFSTNFIQMGEKEYK